MKLSGATSNQAKVVQLVKADLENVGVRLPAGLQVSFDDTNLENDDIGCFQDVGGELSIDLHPALQGGMVYATFLHEIGHALGLNHTSKGIMAAKDGTDFNRKLTLRNRKKWLRQILKYLTDKRLQDLQ
jgi:hypothetical protein